MSALRMATIEWPYLAIAGLFCLLGIFCLKAARNPLEPFRIATVYARTSGATCAVLAVLFVGVFVYVTRRQAHALHQFSATIMPYPGAKYSSRHNSNGEEVWIWESCDEPKKVAAFYSSIHFTNGGRVEQLDEGELLIHNPPKRIRILPMAEGGTFLLVYRITDE